MGIDRVVVDSQMVTISSATVTVTTAGTTALIASMASGTMYITDILLCNGATAGWVYLGYGTGAVAPTTSAIIAQNIYIGVNSTIPLTKLGTPIKITSGNNFLATAVTCTTLSMTVFYYITP